jgi:hypothetical protein
MAREKISLARDIHCCPILYYFFPNNVSVYREICVYILIFYCVNIVYATKQHCEWNIFMQIGSRANSFDWIFITGAPAWRWLGEQVTLDKKFYNLLFEQEILSAPINIAFSSLSQSSKSPLLEI